MGKQNKSIKYRACPTPEQQVLFVKTFGCCRKIWNLMLGDKIKNRRETKSFGKQTPAGYKDEHPYLREVDSLALCNVQLNLEKALSDHFKNKRKKGFPKFKSKHKSKKSYTTNNQRSTIFLGEDFIRLPKAGRVKIKKHHEPEDGWIIKSATVSLDTDGKYYISVLFEFETEIKPVLNKNLSCIGLDYKSDGLFTDSNGNTASHHKFFRESQEKLKRQQRKLARKQGFRKGEAKSNNYKKAVNKSK